MLECSNLELSNNVYSGTPNNPWLDNRLIGDRWGFPASKANKKDRPHAGTPRVGPMLVVTGIDESG